MKPERDPARPGDEHVSSSRSGSDEAPATGGVRRDELQDEQQRRHNRERLNVGENHKTPEMEKGHRGTFP